MQWAQLVLGILVIVSPWTLGASQTVIVWTNALFGGILVLTGVWQIVMQKRDEGKVK
ncbi:MAG: SPW repeat protein [Candidatus Liptonbacteria bacterium]